MGILAFGWCAWRAWIWWLRGGWGEGVEVPEPLQMLVQPECNSPGAWSPAASPLGYLKKGGENGQVPTRREISGLFKNYFYWHYYRVTRNCKTIQRGLYNCSPPWIQWYFTLMWHCPASDNPVPWQTMSHVFLLHYMKGRTFSLDHTNSITLGETRGNMLTWGTVSWLWEDSKVWPGELVMVMVRRRQKWFILLSGVPRLWKVWI